MTGRYQEFDPLTPEEFAALEQDILQRGVQVPIVFDEDGNILDGHHRLTICEKHAITDYPTTVRAGLSEDEKRDLAQSLNMARRSLSREQKQKQIRNRLLRHPDHSDRNVAQALGVDHKTVGRIRKEMESGGEVPQVERKVGVNGMQYRIVKPKLTDAEGGEVPQRLESIFACRGEHRSLVNMLVEIRRRSGELANRTPLRAKLTALRRHLTAAEKIVKETSPHAIHSECNGDGCDGCDRRGFLTAGEGPQRDSGD